MPTVNVDRDVLFAQLGRSYSDDDFAKLCFEFGIELEETTSPRRMAAEQRGVPVESLRDIPDVAIYRIDIPANRTDLLCAEGIVHALRIFLGITEPPCYALNVPAKGSMLRRIVVRPAVHAVRPVILAAIVRNVQFTPEFLASFIDLQDKLHHNICRRRTLASMGTHDLDRMGAGPYIYDARKPEDICFRALGETKEMNAKDLVQHYQTSAKHIAQFVPIIASSPVYPVFCDNEHVYSLPPLINSEHSKITLETKNVFIEVTATDAARARAALGAIIAQLCAHAGRDDAIEAVEIEEGATGKITVTPTVAERELVTSASYVSSAIGIPLEAKKIVSLLARMGMRASANSDQIVVSVPMTRPDVLHECDIAEDAGIAYGYEKLPPRVPQIPLAGSADPMNTLADHVRIELACAGWVEVMPHILCAATDVAPDDPAVTTANACSAECAAARARLAPGMLKTVRENKHRALPLRLFEVGDVVLADASHPSAARNERRVCALYAGTSAGFEAVHGLLDLLLARLGVPCTEHGLEPIEETGKQGFFLPGRGGRVMLRGESIGVIGVVHPDVLAAYDLPLPVSLIELTLHRFL